MRLASLLARFRCVGLRRRVDNETRREIEAHLDLLTDRYVASGMPPAEAHAAARRQFGNVTRVREDIHEMNGPLGVEALLQDLKYGLRQLYRGRAFSAVVVATLGLAIGGTTAVFSLVQSVLLAPLPYRQPGQLVRVYQQAPGDPSTRRTGVSATHFGVLRETASSFTELAAHHAPAESGLDLFTDGSAQRLRTLEVTNDYFGTLRAEPFQGPGFSREDETGTPRVVVSHSIWRTRFGGDRSIIGRTIQLSGEPYQVAGVAPPDFEDPIVGAVDAWLPYDLAGDTFEQNYSLTIIGRLRDGLGLEQAQTELDVLSLAMKQRWPGVTASSIVAVPLKDDVVAASRGLVHLLLIAVGLVLVVACVNVATLALVRTTGRAHEFAVRAALGSGRVRLIRQLLVETLVLAGLGGVLGMAIAASAVTGLQTLAQEALPRVDMAVDAIVFAFATVTTFATAVASGLLPALRASRIDPSSALGHESRSATGTRQQGRVRSGLAAAQLALAVALLAGAGALLASFHRLQQVPLGFRVDGVLTFDVSLPTVRYDAARRAAFQEELARRIEMIPPTVTLTATGLVAAWLPARRAAGLQAKWGRPISR